MDTLQWSAPEYEEKEHSNDWFWALGVIVVCGSIASIIYGNYFFAVLLILGGILLAFFAIKKPEIVPYELGEKGLRIGSRLYPYENIKAFHVRPETPAMFFIRSSRFFLPIISMPIEEAMAEEIRNIMLFKEIPEEKMKEHTSETIMGSLGF